MSEQGTTKRYCKLLQIVCATLWCLVSAGPIFGFAALKPILVSEDVYIEKCNLSTRGGTGHTFLRDFPESSCIEQDLSLNFMFTLAAVVTNMAALPVGLILDTYGPQVSGLVGSVFLIGASLFFKFAKAIMSSTYMLDPYLLGYCCLALGGPFVFISSFQLSNNFPKRSGFILALITGAFDSSLALFFFYRKYYEKVGRVSLDKFFSFYLVVPAFIILCQLTIMPRRSHDTLEALAKINEMGIDENGDFTSPNEPPLEEQGTLSVGMSASEHQPNMLETLSLLGKNKDKRRDSVLLRASFVSRTSLKSAYEDDAEERLFSKSGGIYGILHGYQINDQLKTPWFWLMASFTIVQMLRINYFVATIRSQVLYLYNGDEELASSINQFFDIALPVGGLISIPIVGLILDNLTVVTILSFMVFFSVLFGIMGLLSWLPGTVIGISVLVVFRPFYYTAVSDYCIKVFGFETFGSVYGIIMSISGACNITQHLLDKLTHSTFKMNPTPVNLLLVSVNGLFGASLVSYAKAQNFNLKRRKLELEAQEATVRDVPK